MRTPAARWWCPEVGLRTLPARSPGCTTGPESRTVAGGYLAFSRRLSQDPAAPPGGSREACALVARRDRCGRARRARRGATNRPRRYLGGDEPERRVASRPGWRARARCALGRRWARRCRGAFGHTLAC